MTPSSRRLAIRLGCAAFLLGIVGGAFADTDWELPRATPDEPLPARAPPPKGLTADAARYENGEGIGRDYAMAADLYCVSARAGDPDAAYRLGWMYANGIGRPSSAMTFGGIMQAGSTASAVLTCSSMRLAYPCERSAA